MSKSRMNARERHLMKERERCGRKARFPERRAPRRRFPTVATDPKESHVGWILGRALQKLGMFR